MFACWRFFFPETIAGWKMTRYAHFLAHWDTLKGNLVEKKFKSVFCLYCQRLGHPPWSTHGYAINAKLVGIDSACHLYVVNFFCAHYMQYPTPHCQSLAWKKVSIFLNRGVCVVQSRSYSKSLDSHTGQFRQFFWTPFKIWTCILLLNALSQLW